MTAGLGAFLVIGGLGFYVAAAVPLAGILEARTWAAAQCAIVSSRLVYDEAEGYRVEVIYAYDYDGRSYQGRRLDFNAGQPVGKGALAAIVEAHPFGAEFDCWVDPDDPTRSVINRSPGSFLVWSLLPLAFLGGAVAGILVFLIVRGVIPATWTNRLDLPE